MENITNHYESQHDGYYPSAEEFALCKKVRYLAKLDRFQVEMDCTNNEVRQRFKNYLEYCGYSLKDYFKAFLSNLQPEGFVWEGVGKIDKVITEDGFIGKIAIYEKEGQETLLLSFDVGPCLKSVRMKGICMDGDEKIPCYADCLVGKTLATGQRQVKIMIQKGMMVLPICAIGKKTGTIFWVSKSDVKASLYEYFVQYLQDMFTHDLKLDYRDLEWNDVQEVLVYKKWSGKMLSVILLLLENLIKEKHWISRRPADFALRMFMEDIELTETQMEEITKGLEERIDDRDNMDFRMIMSMFRAKYLQG